MVKEFKQIIDEFSFLSYHQLIQLALKQPQQALDVILSFRPDILCGKTSSLQGRNESQQETNLQVRGNLKHLKLNMNSS